jgi:galactose oxidase-like protein
MTRFVHLVAALVLIVAACSTGATPLPSTLTASPAASPTPSPTLAAAPTSAGPATAVWTRLAPGGDAPPPREDHTWTVDAASGTAWLFGGRDGAMVHDDLWSYNLATDRWTRVEASGDAPAARFGHTGTWVEGVGLVVWSGQSGGDFFADIHAYDPATNRWTRLPDAGSAPEARYGSCAALGPDGRMWISHGFTHAGRFADTRAYDFGTGAWADVTPADAGPVKRCLHDCLWSPDGRLVLYAGQTDGVAALGDLWTLDPAGGWTEAAAPEPPARQLYALAASGTTGWVFGGRGSDGKVLDDFWTLQLETLAWQPVPAAGERPESRAGATLIADPARSRLLLFGGMGLSGALADTWELGAQP